MAKGKYESWIGQEGLAKIADWARNGLTDEQIAKNISSAREAVSRMLKYFQTDGIVELSRKGIRITDKDKLRKMVSESY